MSDAKLKEELRKFKVRLLPEYSRETLDRAARRIEMLAKRGMDPFDVDETWLYEYCASQLDASKKRNSLRIEMEDLGMRVSELLRMNIDERRDKGFFIRSSKKEADRFVALSPPTLDMLEVKY